MVFYWLARLAIANGALLVNKTVTIANSVLWVSETVSIANCVLLFS